MQEVESLGAFYLGRLLDPASGRVTEEPLLYDSRDLTTHAVCVGMTGSGKTGLGVALLEEAALDGIPSIAIDPKGDLGNLLLTFPELRPADFRPWVDEGEAARTGRSAAELAAETATRWRQGLADWGQDGGRIARLRAGADLALYTPGSSAGLQLAVLRGLAAPPSGDADPETARERIAATVSGLLALAGVESDPVRGRDHILLSTLLEHAWGEGRDVDLGALVGAITDPPFTRVGVLDLEAFYPSRERFELAMRLNNLLASPSFAVWMEGEPLDVKRLLWTAEGRPRVSILSIAHLSDAERMFFVTLLLGEVVAWMRAQAGTTSLRAILMMDEVMGYLPPVANPPSKGPMLTLLKQARAFGLGVVVATQNPVDLDYKALSNAGTWFLGRLQTVQDAARVLDGLAGASAAAGRGFDRGATETTLAGLGKRVFLMNDVHTDRPVLFQTRWALSYLRGPLTRVQIQVLTAARRAQEAPRPTAPAAGRVHEPSLVVPAAPGGGASASGRPVVPPEIVECFLTGKQAAGARAVYFPALFASARLHYVQAKSSVDHWEDVRLLVPLDATGNPAWERSETPAPGAVAPSGEPEQGIGFMPLPGPAARPKSYAPWGRQLADHLYRARPLTLHRCAEVGLVSRPGEDAAEFRLRAAQAARERRDRDLEALRAKYAARVHRLEQRLVAARERVAREEGQYDQQKLQTAVSLGTTVLGALFGRKLASAGTLGRATTAARGMGRASREREDVQRAAENVSSLQQELKQIGAELEAEAGRLRGAVAPDTLTLERLDVAPRKADIEVPRLALVWVARGAADDPARSGTRMGS